MPWDLRMFIFFLLLIGSLGVIKILHMIYTAIRPMHVYGLCWSMGGGTIWGGVSVLLMNWRNGQMGHVYYSEGNGGSAFFTVLVFGIFFIFAVYSHIRKNLRMMEDDERRRQMDKAIGLDREGG